MHDEVINLMNQLQDVLSTVEAQNIELPQLVVVGDQSSGKSSVIESIVGLEILPRGSGLVTRRPTVLQMQHQREANAIGAGQFEAKFFHREEIFTDINEIKKEIIRETEESLGVNKNIGSFPISLKITSPIVPSLTLVDLPGLTKIAVGEQPKDIANQIREMIEQYIGNEKAIILVITPATVDFATSEAMALARKADPKGERTIVVITKLDLMDEGTDASDTLMGNVIPNKLGIFGVVNRSQRDINEDKTIKQSIENEKNFLENNYPELASENGTPYLTEKLSELLVEHIHRDLPRIKQTIRTKKAKAEAQLLSIGCTGSKEDILLSTIESFTSNFNRYIDGKITDERCRNELVGGAKLKDIFRRGLEELLDAVDMDEDKPTDRELDLMIQNTQGMEDCPRLSTEAATVLIKSNIKLMETPSYMCASEVCHELKGIVQRNLSEDILKEENLNIFSRYPNLKTSIVAFTETFFEKRLSATCSLIEDLLENEKQINLNHPDMQVSQPKKESKKVVGAGDNATLNNENTPEKAPMPTPTNPKVEIPSKGGGYLGMVWRTPAKVVEEETPEEGNTEEETSQCEHSPKKRNPFGEQRQKEIDYVRDTVERYMKVVRNNLLDSVPKSIKSKMICYIKDNLHREMTKEMHGEDIEDIMAESPTFAAELKEAQDRVEMLRKASTILTEVRKY